jgi:hypothetical protein
MTDQQMTNLPTLITEARRWNAFSAIISVVGAILTGYLFFNEETNKGIVAALVVLSQWISIAHNARTLRSLKKLSPPL